MNSAPRQDCLRGGEHRVCPWGAHCNHPNVRCSAVSGAGRDRNGDRRIASAHTLRTGVVVSLLISGPQTKAAGHEERTGDICRLPKTKESGSVSNGQGRCARSGREEMRTNGARVSTSRPAGGREVFR